MKQQGPPAWLKGAVQEAVRINRYLRGEGLASMVTPRTPTPEDAGAETGAGTYFEVSLEPPTLERVIPNGLTQYRKAQLTMNARTEKNRAVLAGTGRFFDFGVPGAMRFL